VVRPARALLAPHAPRPQRFLDRTLDHRGRRARRYARRLGQPLGSDTLFLTSLYVEPRNRGRGLAARALDAAYRAAVAQGLAGLRLETHWTWQTSLRWYLRRGWWIRNWKHAIALTRRSDWPAYEVRFDGDDATFGLDGSVLLRARRTGRRLTLTSSSKHDLHATATFAAHLACAGWPLVRSERDWQQRWHSSDVGGPEGLAVKIAAFERHATEQGWRVDTPRIPGLDYDAE
jgi:GNAT superfamily N-acetyltransferase